MRTPLPFCFLGLLLLTVGATSARGDESPPTLAAEAAAYLEAGSPEARAAVALRLALRGADARKVRAALDVARTWPGEDAEAAGAGHVVGWKRETRVGDKTQSHSIFARVPETYTHAKAWPVVLWLHGAVRREADGGGSFGANGLGDRADAHGFIVVSPSTYGGVPWWSAEGVRLVRGALDDAKARWNIDANRVYVTGFSDGGSGCYHLLAHDPDPYAAFLPMMGHPAFTRMFGGPTYAANVASRPVFAVNGGRDQLYPSATVKPLVDGLKAAGCRITWKDLPDATHSLNHVAEVWDDLWAFAQANPRPVAASRRSWTTWQPRVAGRLDWVEIVHIDPKRKGDPALAAKALGLPRRALLGVRLDVTFAGPGLRINTVEAGSAAADAGLQPGDLITAIGTEELGERAAAIAALRKALTLPAGVTKKALALSIEREGASQKVTVTAAPASGGAARPASLGYGVPAARVEAVRVAPDRIEVRTHQVGRFRLHLSEALVDFSKPLTVVVNGTPKFQGMLRPDVAYTLAEGRRGGRSTPHNLVSLSLRP